MTVTDIFRRRAAGRMPALASVACRVAIRFVVPALMVAGPALAQDGIGTPVPAPPDLTGQPIGEQSDSTSRLALVVALRAGTRPAGESAADALSVSQAALGAGFDVRRLEYPLSLPPPPATGADVTLIYLSGSATVDSGRAMVGSWSIEDLAKDWAGPGQLIVVAETCPLSRADEAAGAAAAAEQVMEVPPRTLIAMSQSGSHDCGSGRLTGAVTAALAARGQDMGRMLTDSGFHVVTGPGWRGFVAQEAAAVADDGLIIAGPLRPVDPVSLGAPATAGTGVEIINLAASTAPFAGDRIARPTQSGLPDPSVIVGDAPPDADATPPDEDISGQPLGTGFDDRERIRREDPALFASLLESGTFDPPTADLASAIQSELQRMECYRGQVDGQWGNGSRGAVDRYFTQAGGPAVGREPDVALFRAVVQRPDIRCPAPVAQPQTPARTQPAAAGGSTRRATSSQPAARQPSRAASPQRTPQRQQPAAQPPSNTRRIDPNALGTGVFR